MAAFSTQEVLERLEILWRKLEDEGRYVSANTVSLAIDQIKIHVRRQTFLEAAEIASLTAADLRNGDKSRFTAAHIAMALKKKAEE